MLQSCNTTVCYGVHPLRRLALAVILACYLLLAGLYAVRTPKWQAPDEPAHFNYIRAIAETGTLPVLQPGDYDQEYLEEIKSKNFPADMSVDSIRYESWQPPLYYVAAVPLYLATRAGGVDAQVLALRLFSVLLEVIVLLVAFVIVREVFPADSLLPLATVAAMATIPMHLAVTASISNDTAAELLVALMLWLGVLRLKNQVTSRRFVILGGLLFSAGLLTKSTTWVTGASVLIAAEVGRWTLLGNQAGAESASGRLSKRKGSALLVPLTPQTLTEGDSSSADSTDLDREPVASRLQRPPAKGNGGETGEGAGNRPATPVSVAIAPAKRNRPSALIDHPWRPAVSHLVALFSIAVVLSSPMFIRNMAIYGITDPLVMGRHESVVIGQPTTAEMIAQLGASRVAQNFLAITLRSFWAQFGWMGVLVDERIYLALFALTAVALLGLALYAYRLVQQWAWLDDTTRWCLGVMALLVITAIVDYLGYNGKFFQAQGRYLFPALIPIALFFVLGLREILSKEHARFLFALLYLMMVGLDIAALFLYIVPQLTT
jgi:hypothetical protein